MAVTAKIRLPLLRVFNGLQARLGHPKLYIFPWQTPVGLTYDADLDAWVNGAGQAVDPDLYDQLYTEIPALWGADAESLALAMGGITATGDLVVIAKAEYASTLTGAYLVRTGAPDGEKYVVSGSENAPDGGAAVFTVVNLKRREK